MLCPSEEVDLGTAIFLDGQIERITGTAFETDVDVQIDSVKRRHVSHAPTLAYHFRDAIVYDGLVYSKRMRKFIGEQSVASNRKTFNLSHRGGMQWRIQAFRALDHRRLHDLSAREGIWQASLSLDEFPARPHKGLYAQYFDQDRSPIDRARVDHLVVLQDLHKHR